MGNCIFCSIAKGEAKSWKVYEDKSTCAFLDINPVNEYHTLVITRDHYVNLFDVPEPELLKVMAVVKKLSTFYRERLGITDVQVISCAGVAAQQDVFHFHVHIVPRKEGDGQDVLQKTHPEWRARFDQMLERVKQY